MKNYLLAFACLSFTLYSQESQEPLETNSIDRKKPSSERAENAKFVLANIAQMIGQIGTIIEEPKDAQNIETAVTNIVNNIVKITLHAVQNKHIDIKDAQDIMETLYETCKDLNNESIIHIITTKKALI